MQLSRRQVIWISVISGVVLLLTLAAVLIFTPGDEDVSSEPAATPLETASPTVTPVPTVTPSPTAFRLPLVPQWETPQPAAGTDGIIGAFVPRPTASPDTALPAGPLSPWVEADG